MYVEEDSGMTRAIYVYVDIHEQYMYMYVSSTYQVNIHEYVEND